MSPHEELFRRLLDESSALLAAPEGSGMAIPDDELHREIIIPLLPAMLADAAIREHWSEQAATGFAARLARHLAGGEPAPRWLAADFEIHVTGSYNAGPDAKALADTLLSEDSLRDLTAALMNQFLDALWPALAPASREAEPEVEIAPLTEPIETPKTPETPPVEIAQPPERIEMPGPAVIPSGEVLPAASEQESPTGLQLPPLPRPIPSHALVRALCRELGASVVQRGLAASGARGASAALIARRILQRARIAASACRPTSPRRLPRRASL